MQTNVTRPEPTKVAPIVASEVLKRASRKVYQAPKVVTFSIDGMTVQAPISYAGNT